jgi:NADH-quinone oxidoreductase subunit M
MPEIHWSPQAAFPLLAVLQLLPLAGAVVTYALRERRHGAALGRLIGGIELLLAVELTRRIDRDAPGLQFVERIDLPGPLDYHVGADGVTAVFVLLTALIVFLVSFYSMVRDLPEPGRLLAVVLGIEAVLMSLLATTNLLWFALASTVELGLIGYLLWRWAMSPEKDRALRRFYQFQGTGVLLLFIGALLAGEIHEQATGGVSYELAALAGSVGGSPLATLVFVLLFLGLAIRAPLFPFHAWLPVVAHHGNVAIAPAFLLGIKVGIYGLVRFVLPILPEAAVRAQPYVLAAALAGVFYAALLAFQQTNLRRLLAFAVVSHTSLLALGLFTLEPAALQGAVLLAVTFGLAATAMLFMVGFVYRRTASTDLTRLGGLFDRIPAIALAFLVAGLAVVCMPGTPGFDAAHLLFEGAIHRFGATATVAGALGNVVAAGFLLWAFQRAFLAPAPAGRTAAIERATWTELLIAFAVIAALLVTGFHMDPWLELVDTPLRALGARFAPG